MCFRSVEARHLLLHGSNRLGVEQFEPREQGDFAGRPVCAVFATDDEIWPMYFAVVNRERVGGLINSCGHVSRDGVRRSRYLFAIRADPADPASWRDGAVYAFSRAPFVQQTQPREWLSFVAVEPLVEVPVSPGDFPFLADVLPFGVGDTPTRMYLRQARLRWSASLRRRSGSR